MYFSSPIRATCPTHFDPHFDEDSFYSYIILPLTILFSKWSLPFTGSIKWVGHAAGMGEPRNGCRILVGKHEGGDQLRDPRLDGRIV
jgi:hypothetical protein